MISLKRNDYETPILFKIKTKEKEIPLIGSKVIFDFISKATNKRIGGGECKIIDEALGQALYEFKDGELAQSGEYQAKVTIDLSQGARREGLTLEFNVVD